MRIDGRLLNWGVFFILLGAIPLAVQAGALDADLVSRAWQLWPLLFIAAGVGILLQRTRLHFAGGLLAAATVGLMVGGLLAAGNLGGIGNACGGDPGRAYATQTGSLAGGTASVEFTCGDLTVQTAPGTTWTLAGSSSDGALPNIDTAATRLDIRSRGGTGFFGFGSHQTWNLTLPADPTIDLSLQVNAGSSHVALGAAHLGTVQLQGNASSSVLELSDTAALGNIVVHMNAGSARIDLPNRTLSGTVDANAGSVSLCVPDGVGLRITENGNITSGNNYAQQGLTKTGDTWETANAGTVSNLITLTANANAGSINLNPKDGCR